MKIPNSTFFKSNIIEKQILSSTLPQVCYLTKFLQPQTTVKKGNFFSGLKNAIVNAKETVVATTKKVANAVKTGAVTTFEVSRIIVGNKLANNTISADDVISSVADLKKLKEARKEYEGLCERYTRLFGMKLFPQVSLPYKSLTISELQKEITTLYSVVEREEMMISLERKFKKGATSYLPDKYAVPFKTKELKEICSNKKIKSYKKELINMAQVFIENSCRVEDSMSTFNKLSKNYFSHAAQSVKEIYDIKSDNVNQWLERIPKLGIIPKALRVKEQTRLTRCVLSDFKDISKKYVAEGMKPYLQKYNNQYAKMQNFIDEHRFKAFFHRKYTNRIMQKVNEVKTHRLKAQAELLNNFATNGANLTMMCHSIEHSGQVEIAKKALFLLIPYL